MDIFWLRDERLDDSATLSALGMLAAESAEDPRSILAQFRKIAEDLGIPDDLDMESAGERVVLP